MTRKGLDWTEKFPGVAASGRQAARQDRVDRRRTGGGGQQGHFELLAAAAGPQSRPRRPHGASMPSISCISTAPISDRCRLPRARRRSPPCSGAAMTAPICALAESLHERGPVLLKHACRMGLEGIISKLRGCALSFRARPRLAQDQMLRPAGIRGGGLCALDQPTRMRSARWCSASTTAATCNMPAAWAPASPMTRPATLYRTLKSR